MSHPIQAVILDIQGVLFQEGQVIDGAQETLQWLMEKEIPFVCCTNTTTRTRTDLAERFQAHGFSITEDRIFSAIRATHDYLHAEGLQRIFPVLDPNVRSEFAAFTVNEESPEAVVVGDIGEDWNAALIDRVFRAIHGGARLVAAHRNRTQKKNGAIVPDVGLYVAGLEYASGTEAVLVGKPSDAFFRSAAASLDCSEEHILMVGDDPESDIGGAAACGLQTCQVKTGKYEDAPTPSSGKEPDYKIDSIADLPKCMRNP